MIPKSWMIRTLPRLQRICSTHNQRQAFRAFSSESHIPIVGQTNYTPSGGSSHDDQLMRVLSGRIRLMGPITVAQYMQEVLCHPTLGYYAQGDVFGAKGDFVTSPEISQMFGECLAIWVVNEWEKMGQPRPLQLVELGPGRGTLMKDIMSTLTKLLPKEIENLSVHLVEISEKMRKLQEASLCGYSSEAVKTDNEDALKSVKSRFGPTVTWYRDLRGVPKQFSFFIAHEFFDAIPVHQFVKGADHWHEVLVDIDQEKGGLRFVKSRERTPNCILIDKEERRETMEISAKQGLIVQDLCSRISTHGGAALIADYGHDGEKEDTFRAFKKHELVNPLVDPGHADLTADVDFNFLRRNCDQERVLAYGPVDQGDFLHRLGIGVRKDNLLKKCEREEIRKDIESSYQVLTKEDQMGKRFKFFSIFPKTMSPIHEKFPPAGFEKNESE